jgi:hypothetical protein
MYLACRDHHESRSLLSAVGDYGPLGEVAGFAPEQQLEASNFSLRTSPLSSLIALLSHTHLSLVSNTCRSLVPSQDNRAD